MTAHSNIEPAFDAFIDSVVKLGKSEVEGESARSTLALRVAEAAREGIIDETDMKEVYAAYVKERHNPKAAKQLLVGDGTKAQQSKLAQVAKMGALPLLNDPFDSAAAMLERALKIASTFKGNDDGPKPKAPFDAMVDVARAQLKQPDVKLTDEQLTATVCKPERADKGEIEKLCGAYKTLHKIATDYPRPETDVALADLKAAIVEAGGDVPAMTKEEKQEAAAMAFLARRGMVAVGALPAQ